MKGAFGAICKCPAAVAELLAVADQVARGDLPEGAIVRFVKDNQEPSLRANDDETNACREFTLEGIGQTSRGYAPNQRQQDPCSGRR